MSVQMVYAAVSRVTWFLPGAGSGRTVSLEGFQLFLLYVSVLIAVNFAGC